MDELDQIRQKIDMFPLLMNPPFYVKIKKRLDL